MLNSGDTTELFYLILFFGYSLAKNLLLFGLVILITFAVVNFFFIPSNPRKTKEIEYDEVYKIIDKETKTHTYGYRTKTKTVIDHEAETPEFLQQYYEKKHKNLVRSNYLTGKFLLVIVAIMLSYYSYHLYLNGFTLTTADLQTFNEDFDAFKEFLADTIECLGELFTLIIDLLKAFIGWLFSKLDELLL